jgi:branched-chain amino acid transport system ATP-binding protein
MGLVTSKKGRILFDNTDVSRLKPYQIAAMGIGYVPEERAIFPSLSVFENLCLPAKKGKPSLWNMEKIYSYFPILKGRAHQKGSQLSGGEQQMLAIARVLTMDVKLILMDEPTEGLAPFLVREIGNILKEIRNSGITNLLVEQNTRFALGVADRHHILYEGKIAYQGTNVDFEAHREIQTQYLGV